ncbi:glucuronate isomerase [Thalassoglobus polymorphus]|uniref:Uronate isomerase n=1 Tax=Thalassoglobus polymorphus TaxID=2527994 RepID=A0A517QU06_9PLAN|nr:glucuronate isomerase [Thalassoglobus polymorphus]QDT35125.1 Uronate isomerase [Thalassoglobus polymorphus]
MNEFVADIDNPDGNTMTTSLEKRLFDELEQLVLIDPHTHINPHEAPSKTLADIMGYHYYTELAHSAGLEKSQIEEDGLDPKTKVGRLVEKLSDLDNTIQVSWLLEMCREFFGFTDDRITPDNWEGLYDTALAKMSEESWEQQVLEKSKLEKVFLTNDFDDKLEGFDTNIYVPCLRTDDLVFHFLKKSVRNRLNEASGIEVGDSSTFRAAIAKIFSHFVEKNAKACAISIPPNFSPQKVDAGSAAAVIKRTVKGQRLTSTEQEMLSSFAFWTLAEQCDEHGLPFDLMIGVNRRVYEGGVYQGQDLFDKRVSLLQYKQLFNAFPNVTFPVSVLGSTSNQELVSYSWIFPNVVTNGHWWYSNIPTYIEVDTRSRLEAVPRNKQIGYYSDMYKLEFALPKFRMYRRVLAKVLASDFVTGRGWTETQAIDFGKQVLRGNVETIFKV